MKPASLAASAEDASPLLTAMANPKRLMILCYLLGEELNVSQLATRVELGQSPLSQHLSRLRALGLVKTRPRGTIDPLSARLEGSGGC